MSKSKQARSDQMRTTLGGPSKAEPGDQTRRRVRDPGPDEEQSDGRIEAELDELDTDKYEPPPHTERQARSASRSRNV
jgi:hypothetical protein